MGRENLRPGDVILCNDPYNGGFTHCPDIVVLCPAFFKGEIHGWAAFRGHTVDMGGIYPGGWYSNTTEVFQEGFRLPPVKIWVEGKPNEDVFRLIQTNTRVPESVLGDIRAMIAGVRTGSQRLVDTLGRQHAGLHCRMRALDLDTVEEACPTAHEHAAGEDEVWVLVRLSPGAS